MKYPSTKKSCVIYAKYLTSLHKKEYIAMEHPEKERGLINFIAVEKNGLSDFIACGWEIIRETLPYTVQRFSQYKLGNDSPKHDDWADSHFETKEEAERYSLTADSGIGGDTRYSYKVVKNNK